MRDSVRFCVVCGEEFTIPCQRGRARVTCSVKCRKERLRQAVDKWCGKHRPRKVQDPKICRVCEKSFIPRRNTQKTCSKECRKKWEKKYTHTYLMNRYKTDSEFRKKWIKRCKDYNNVAKCKKNRLRGGENAISN
jgi:predicted nucleic acid-binding Zn ribbon protein